MVDRNVFGPWFHERITVYDRSARQSGQDHDGDVDSP